MSALARELPAFAPGWVWLVGAGPGDPGLLSLLALHALERADVVVYDALVSERILALARAGRAPASLPASAAASPRRTQPDISLRLIRLAREGNRVLRLKGGDPFVFGRGGEEALGACRGGHSLPHRARASPPASAGSPMPASRPPIATPTRRSPSSPATASAAIVPDGHRLAGARARRAGAGASTWR